MYTHGTILHTEASCLCVCGPVSYLITQTRVSWKYRRVLQAGRMRLTLPQEALRMYTHGTILHTEASCLCVCGPVSCLITQTRVSWKYRRVLQAGRMRLTLPQEA